MPRAYQKASGGGAYPVAARQVMCAARPAILAETATPLDDVYFTQQLRPKREHPQQTANWDVVYDARGHLYEPHTETEIALGTLDVRRFSPASRRRPTRASRLSRRPCGIRRPDSSVAIPTCYASKRKGFLPHLRQAQISERFDVALMSSKGMSSTADRHLIERKWYSPGGRSRRDLASTQRPLTHTTRLADDMVGCP